MELKQSSELARCNHTAMIGHSAASFVYILIAFMEYRTNENTLLHLVLIFILASIPVIAEYILWKKNPNTNLIMHFVGIGFPFLYTYALLTTSLSCTYIFFLPMFMVVSVYGDQNYLLKENAGVIILNTFTVIAGAKTGKFGYSGPEAAIVQMITVIIAAIASYFTIRTLSLNNNQKLEEVTKSHLKTEQVLQRITKVSFEMKEGITMINEKASALNSNAEINTQAMEEVTQGTSNTTEALQTQLKHTESINDKINELNNAALTIQENMDHTLSVLDTGKKDVDILVQEVESSVDKGADVADKLETLDQYIEKMHSIVELINGITSQTSLLALNASIEAARAGDAGRGFAVVASEITAMANQTQNATVQITSLIDDVSKAITQVVSVVREMIQGINEEKKSTENTSDSFQQIEKNTYRIRDHVNALSLEISALQEANQKIADSIQTISSISYEVSEHAEETLNNEKRNKENLDEIARQVHELTLVIQE